MIMTDKKSITLLVLYIVILSSLAIPSDVLGYTFVAVTSNGVEFPILSLDVSGNSTGTGDGDSILDGLGVYLTIQNIGTNGVIYFGEDGTNDSAQTDIRQYIETGSNDDWVIAISDDDTYETMVVPEFGVEYDYSNSMLTLVENVIPNVLGYSTSRVLTGSVTPTLSNDGITLSGTGEIILALNDYTNQTLILRGNGTGDVKIVTSDHDLINDAYTGNGYLTYSANIDPGTNSFSVTAGIDSTHTGFLTFDGHAWREDDGGICAVSSSSANMGDLTLIDDDGFNCLYRTTNPYTQTTTLVKTNNVDHYTITGDSTTPAIIDLGKYYWGGEIAFGQYNDNFNFELYDTLPSVQKGGWTDDFEQVLAFPSEQTYLYADLNSETITIKGESIDPDSYVFFQVNNLPADIAYDITKSGITGIVGKTGSSGEISLLVDDVDFGIASSPGGILKIYQDSAKYLGTLGIGMIDLYNEYSIPLTIGEDMAYIPQNYVYWVFPVGVEVTNLRVDDVPLDYLNRNYTQNEALYIPVIPSADIIYATIDGEDVEILMRDVSYTTQTKQVPIESSTTSNYMVDGSATTSSNISTSTFLTATHTGTMYANLDFKVGGSADFSMDSTYTGGFTEHTNCKWHGASSPYRTFSCRDYFTPSDPASITNMASLTADHQTQLTTALNNNQVSNLTVEVDIIRNMGEDDDLESILVYTSNSAEAFITSTFSEAGYGASNQVYITYPLTSISENIAIPVTVGDMMEFVIRVNLEVSGAPALSSENAIYSSYVQATTELGGGIITVGMS